MPSDAPATIREASGLFHDRERLQEAVSELESSGFPRADLSLLARESLLEGGVKGDYQKRHEMDEASDDPNAPREPVVAEDDVRQVRTLTTAIAGYLGAAAGAGITVLTGGAALAAIGAAAAVGAASAGAVEMVGQKVGKGDEDHIRQQLEHGGVILWVHTPTPEAERRAAEILRRHEADYVHVHDMPAA